NVATVYPDVQCLDTDDTTLKPLFFTIKFSSTLPRHLIEQNIPIEILVSIAEEYGCFTMPFLNIMPVDLWQFDAGSSLHSGDSDVSTFGEYITHPDDIPIPFLPLPPAFNYTIQADWVALSKQIKKWLVELNTELPQWTWGRDTFWLAFVAGYPFFPRGNWRMWDPRIPLEGVFIERWLE
ncbi:uncharacterized protein EDB91DRAFT_1013145, partial [Suillus paluster]|uniref:uncharacterized protein n=1 Tax=Suillus paluster TaxID=48578 RepID=UPI001B870490